MAATPKQGKTTTRHFRLLAGGHNLSGSMRSINAFGVRFGEDDVSGWSDDIKQWLSGFGDVLLEGFTALFNSQAAAIGSISAGSHPVLSGATGDNYVSVFMGIQAAPAVGNPTFSAPFQQGGYTVNGGDGPVMVSANFHGKASAELGKDVWGVALAAGEALSATGENDSVDNGAATTNGYIVFIHLPQTAGAMGSNDWSFVIEHSANDTDWATLKAITADGSAITAERQEGAGTVNRYVRFAYTRTAGTAEPWVSFIRK